MDASTPQPNFGRNLWNKIRNGRLNTTFAVLAALSVGVLAGSVLTGNVSANQQKVDSTDARPLIIPSPQTLSNGFASIVKQVGPAVVNINTESLPKAQGKNKRRGLQRGPLPAQPDGNDDGDNSGSSQGDMQDFFNRFFGGQGGIEGVPENSARRALGSGFIVDPRGYIITNNHVVADADHIYVKLSTDPDSQDQGRPATVVGTDKETDIAVIKIDPKGLTLPVARLGNSDGAQVGDWVLAIGSPLGLSQTVSAGIVSAKNRSIDEPSADNISHSTFQKFIQTDASINPGNSGGPLVDLAGEVIGMNTAIYTQSGGAEGIGFAMPSNIIAGVYNMLISPEHKVTRGSIGITLPVSTSSAAAREYGFDKGGVYVNSVTPGLPADKAGIHPKDVIVTIDGTPIKDGDQLIAIISAKRPGSTIKLGYLREGKLNTTVCGIIDRAKLTEDKADAGDDAGPPDAVDAGKDKLGITVKPLDAATATKLHVPGGVVVSTVKTGSFAYEINLGKGAIITEINRKPVSDMASYNAVVTSLKPGQDVVFVITGSNGSSLLGGTLP